MEGIMSHRSHLFRTALFVAYLIGNEDEDPLATDREPETYKGRCQGDALLMGPGPTQDSCRW